jgi:hypothetical protein
VDAPILRGGAPGLVVTHTQHGTALLKPDAAFSRDGVDWEILPARSFPTAFDLLDIAGSGSGFIAVGEIDGKRALPVALTSTDGRHWTNHALSTAALGAGGGASAGRIVVGSAGVVATGWGGGGAPAMELWWTSTTGSTWHAASRYPPLGVWNGQGEGTGLMADGTLAGDGERFLAYRRGGEPAGWTSFDGRSWQSVVVKGSSPATGSGTFILTPIGVTWVGDDGSTWLGAPKA